MRFIIRDWNFLRINYQVVTHRSTFMHSKSFSIYRIHSFHSHSITHFTRSKYTSKFVLLRDRSFRIILCLDSCQRLSLSLNMWTTFDFVFIRVRVRVFAVSFWLFNLIYHLFVSTHLRKKIPGSRTYPQTKAQSVFEVWKIIHVLDYVPGSDWLITYDQ